MKTFPQPRRAFLPATTVNHWFSDDDSVGMVSNDDDDTVDATINAKRQAVDSTLLAFTHQPVSSEHIHVETMDASRSAQVLTRFSTRMVPGRESSFNSYHNMLYYNDSYTDTVLQSADGKAFRVHSVCMKQASRTLNHLLATSKDSTPIPIAMVDSLILDHVLQCIYKETRPKNLPPHHIPWQHCIPFLSACLYLGVDAGIQEGKTFLGSLIESLPVRCLVFLLVQLERYPLMQSQEVKQLEISLVRQVCMWAKKAAETPEAVGLSCSYAIELKNKIADQQSRWAFCARWLQAQPVDTEIFAKFLAHESADLSYLPWLVSFLVLRCNYFPD